MGFVHLVDVANMNHEQADASTVVIVSLEYNFGVRHASANGRNS